MHGDNLVSVCTSDSLTHPLPHIFLSFSFWRASFNKSWCPRKCQFSNTVLSTAVTRSYIKSSDLVHLIAKSFHLFTNVSYFPFPSPGNYFSTLFLVLLFGFLGSTGK